jgi:uncharacterized SAM-binding protein YcdF (DUF218 family)
MKKIITLLGILIIIAVTMGSIMANFNVGNAMLYALGFTLALWFHVPENRFFKALKVLAAVGFGIVFIMIGFIFVSADTNKASYDEDAVIVLGCSVIGDRISLPLQYRLDSAYEYYLKNPDAIIVVSGGQGPQENISEAEAMYNYLCDKGVAPQKIIMENKATSTNENYIYSKALLDEYFNGSSYKCVYVTNRFHTYRAGKLAELNGLQATSVSAPIGILSATTCYMREVLAVFQLWLFNR